MYHAILCRLKDAENPQDRVESAGVPHRSRRHIIAPSLRTALCTAYHNSPGKLWTLIEQGFPQEVRRVLGGMIFGICRFTDMLTKEWSENALGCFGLYGDEIVVTEEYQTVWSAMYGGSFTKRKYAHPGSRPHWILREDLEKGGSWEFETG
jgi:hypothetical protein